jgi:simple sugar transport system ATP-binding protein
MPQLPAPGPVSGVSFRHVTKAFGPVLALEDVSFDVRPGSFHAVLGENGAGKTTLMRILAGELRPDPGTVVVDGEPRTFRSPRDARQLGIRMVHQHSILIPNLSIRENFLLDADDAPALTRSAAFSRQLQADINDFGLEIDPRQPVWTLSGTERQWIEVFRALRGRGRVVVLDEPTALLSPIDGDKLLDKLKALTAGGISMLLITHKLREVFKYADTVTVLRKGRWVVTTPVTQQTHTSLAEFMVGTSAPLAARRELPQAPSTPLLSVNDLTCRNRRGRIGLKNVSLSLCRGEILGVAGVSGNGQGELARAVAGISQPESGSIRSVDGGSIVRRYIPDDRINVATAARLSVADNLVLREFARPPLSKKGWLQYHAIDGLTTGLITQFKIKTPSASAAISKLSGGNIQRVVLARELNGSLDLLVAHNPTAGLDLATSEFVRDQLLQLKSKGGSVLLISDDLDELLAVSDRIVVLHGRTVAGELARPGFDRVALGRLMSGGEPSLSEARPA